MSSLPAKGAARPAGAPSAATPFVSALLGEERSALLQRVVEGLPSETLNWLSGYLAGLATQRGPLQELAPAPVAQAVPEAWLTIVYGTQTNNSRMLAERLKHQAEASGLSVRLYRASDYPVRELAKERLLYIVISTQGDGDPPDDSRGFVEFLLSKKAPKLEQLRFSVLGLGDSSYPKYCEIGRVLDARLAQLGATRLLDRADCDVDFEPVARGWLDHAVGRATEELAPKATTAVVTQLRTAPPPPKHGKEAPVTAELLVNQRLTGRSANKDVRHIELSLGDSGLTYEPGDSLGVWPRNSPELVSDFLSLLKADGSTELSRDGRTLPLNQWLTEELELTKLSRPILERHAALSESAELQRLLAPEGAEAFRALLKSHQIIDLLRLWPAPWTAAELVRALRKLAPRSYSIASSQKRVGAEAHLTVAVVDYVAFGARHTGTASYFLASRTGDEERVRVFVEPNERFRLPRDSARDVIMIGPGTGVAPFRAFVQERAETGAKGRNWLFFGEQHFRSQFLYQTEWQEALKKGELHRLSLAFSRDQAEKIYVQQRLREAGKDIYAWLEGGAHLYVCGDAQRMAPDVHEALIDIVTTHGGRSREDAEAWLSTLRDEQRYQRDVY
jgi:sulfite reductase (NADPH) flavoprotein alpha-component